MISINLASEVETGALGRALAGHLAAGDLVLLSGGLGVGKSTLVRALLRELAGAEIDVPSPTFTLIERYDLNLTVHHVDLYRLSGEDQILELGLDDLLDVGAMLVEWPEQAPSLARNPHLSVAFSHGENDLRTVQLSSERDGWAGRLEAIAKEVGAP
ncbi:MAG: tRNA (adenosine(37)-N6)-threonylcarbamoyltransferase complex ATPase subunit type 1 TsaE [Parvularculaceae bacterium]|nr:tRNA (adenosine(37)-N6)-threonylcarbamoyltransferase complex ATPase subunit type 1 TsaE [Parvularculaceae bacterium]